MTVAQLIKQLQERCNPTDLVYINGLWANTTKISLERFVPPSASYYRPTVDSEGPDPTWVLISETDLDY
jgi:hypothetical protein